MDFLSNAKQRVVLNGQVSTWTSVNAGVLQGSIVSQTNSQKHLGVTSVLKLTFEEHLLNVFKTVNRTIGLIRKLQNVLPRISLVTIYKEPLSSSAFFPSTISEWNKLVPPIRNSESLSIFRKNILHFIRPAPNSIYNSYNPKGVKLITRLQLGLSHIKPYVIVVTILNLQLIIFFIVPYLLMKEALSSAL